MHCWHMPMLSVHQKLKPLADLKRTATKKSPSTELYAAEGISYDYQFSQGWDDW